jgi:hypothetical protein
VLEEPKIQLGKRISKAALREAIHRQFLSLGYSENGQTYSLPENLSKQRVRELHAAHRMDSLAIQRSFVKQFGSELVKNFATGSQIDPSSIQPELVEVAADTPESHLFRFATLLWSVPVSQGFGRRLRFLVRDRQNGKLMGLFALGDPVFNLTARDKWIGWTHGDRAERLIHVMDAYVVGAVPPYAKLIGGKLIAALMASSEVIEAHERKYSGKESVISREIKRARLVLITTTSALGRSSLYNRLVIPGGPRFLKIGATKGYGHFHLSGSMFDSMRRYLIQRKHPYASGHRFGMGPNWRLRVAREALEDAGISGEVLRHGIPREVYAVPLAENWKEVLLGRHSKIRTRTMSAKDIAEFCLNRWIIPRSIRDKSFKRTSRDSILHWLMNGGPPSSW